MTKLFKENLELFREKSPSVAFLVGLRGEEPETFPSNVSSDRVIHELPDVLFVLGIGTGEFYRHYKDWLSEKPERAIVFIEDDLSIWYRFLHLEGAKEMLMDPQVEFVLAEEFNRIAWKFLFQPYQFVCLPYAESGLQKKLEEVLFGVFLVASDYKNFGIDILNNIYRNALYAEETQILDGLRDSFQKIPAIICGAGPSLEKQLDLLRNCDQKALIFAGGAAIDMLSQEGVSIHVGAGIDPDPDINRFTKNTKFELPFFYMNRLKHSVFCLQQGLRFLAGTTDGYPIERWLYESAGLGIPFIDGGFDVSNFCTHVAYLLGCDPIIFVGMDHFGSEKKMYVGSLQSDREEELLPCKDMYGNEGVTKKDWLMATEWLGQFAKEHPETRFLNATEGGLKIEGVFHLAFADAASEFLKRAYDIEGKFHAKGLHAMRGTKLSKSFGKIEKSLEDVKTILGNMLTVSESEFRAKEADLESEIAYQYILDPIWLIWKHVFSRLTKDKKNKIVFFQNIVDKHLKLVKECNIRSKSKNSSSSMNS